MGHTLLPSFSRSTPPPGGEIILSNLENLKYTLFPSCLLLLCQNESLRETIHMKISSITSSFLCKSNSHFHMEVIVRGLVLKQRYKVTQTWHITKRFRWLVRRFTSGQLSHFSVYFTRIVILLFKSAEYFQFFQPGILNTDL